MAATAGAAAASGKRSSFDHNAVTRSLLGYGVIAGPFFVTVGVVQGLVRDGFDFGRHPLSVLANGPGGWVQVANFLLTGLMVVAAAVGIARAMGKGRATSWFVAIYGLSMIAAAFLRADPIDGFPPGTPEGMPTSISPTGLGHFVAGALGFMSLAVSALVASVAFSKRGVRWLSQLSLASGIAVLLGFFGGQFLGASSVTLGIWFAVLVGWAWLAVVSAHLYRTTPKPENCEPAG